MIHPVEYRLGLGRVVRPNCYSTGLAPWNNAVNEKITLLWKGYSTGRAAKTQSENSKQRAVSRKQQTARSQNGAI